MILSIFVGRCSSTGRLPVLTTTSPDFMKPRSCRPWRCSPAALRVTGRATAPACSDTMCAAQSARNSTTPLILGAVAGAVDGRAVLEAGHLGHPVDDEHAVEVVVLVLPASGEEAGAGGCEPFSIEAGGGDRDRLGAKDIAADVGKAQAPLLVGDNVALGV